MRDIKYLVVHCTASPQTQKVKDILSYWKNALGWKAPGYHVIVEPNGTAHELQNIASPTNGVRGFNSNSIHISYIGGVDVNGKALDNRTPEQKKVIREYLLKWKKQFPKSKIKGHRDFSPDKNGNGRVDPWERIKECPSFDAVPEYAGIL
jgi:N-acetylmuramoyl-L-alanine amidase